MCEVSDSRSETSDHDEVVTAVLERHGLSVAEAAADGVVWMIVLAEVKAELLARKPLHGMQ